MNRIWINDGVHGLSRTHQGNTYTSFRDLCHSNDKYDAGNYSYFAIDINISIWFVELCVVY